MCRLFRKKIFILCALMCIFTTFFCGCSSNSDDIVRIHIRANSNNTFDQEVKLKVRDSVVDYITPKIDGCSDSEEVKLVLQNNIDNIKNIADSELIANGCNYVSTVSIDNEYFPSRDYDGVVFPANYYDALIIRLGSGIGDNWWCVAYPPLCFVSDGSDKIVYKSKLVEIIEKLFG